MALMNVATVKMLANCRWSRPGYRLSGVDDDRQPEPVLVCVRTGERRGVDVEVCDDCPFWEPDPTQVAVSRP